MSDFRVALVTGGSGGIGRAPVAWLASPAAGFVTGANFTIDGGMTRKMIYA